MRELSVLEQELVAGGTYTGLPTMMDLINDFINDSGDQYYDTFWTVTSGLGSFADFGDFFDLPTVVVVTGNPITTDNGFDLVGFTYFDGDSGSTGVDSATSDIPIAVKDGIDTSHLHSEIKAALSTVKSVWAAHGDPDPVITSANDGNHMDGSKHYTDDAVDIRGNNVSDAEMLSLGQDLQHQLGPSYNLVVEYFDNPANDHIHIEYDPNNPQTDAAVADHRTHH